ncbi:MAG: multicopper oxidase domain-containing protein, partial [Bacteroidia bacterium]|nr:multicopper oxidase domain-containing protein [Bacteroidia bacterium]
MKNLFNICLGLLCLNAVAQTTQLAIPDTLIGPNYTLNMHKDSVQFFPGNKSHTYAFNSFSYLGPTLIFNKGANVNITVNNQIGDTTTVHWHGIHLPSKWDGGPHTPILPSASWNPTFTVMDNAATYWYHPHLHMKTAEQAIKGAAGLIIVRDPIEAALNLPRKYGIDDFPLVIQCQQYDSANQAMPLGMQDSTILINGARANYGYTVYANCPAQVVRMRILNASGERAFNFGFTANMQFKIIASDGGLLNAPVNTTRLRLAPGERAEILLDLTGMNGQTIHLMSYASELAMGIQGGPTMPMPSGPPMDSPLNGVDFNVMQINVVPQTASPITTIPATLTTNNPYPTGSANVTRTIRFTADSMMVMDGPFYFNDSTFNMMRIDYEIPMNNIEIWKLVNETMVAHPFHIHDVQFYLF